MKKLAFGIASLALVLSATVALACSDGVKTEAKTSEGEGEMHRNCQNHDMVDIGNPESEADYVLGGWGPVQPNTSGGNWGGIGAEGGNARVTWEPGGNRGARVDLWLTKNDRIEIRHLDGIADDSFVVRVNGVYAGSYTDQHNHEEWHVTSFDVPDEAFVDNYGCQPLRVRIRATGEAWSGFDTYGQLGIDWIKVEAGK